jgi:hypothetical protein
MVGAGPDQVLGVRWSAGNNGWLQRSEIPPPIAAPQFDSEIDLEIDKTTVLSLPRGEYLSWLIADESLTQVTDQAKVVVLIHWNQEPKGILSCISP